MNHFLPQSRLLFEDENTVVVQNMRQGLVEMQFKGVTMAFTLGDLYEFVERLDNLPVHQLYLVELLDLRDTCVRAGFQAIGLQMSLSERDELSWALHNACLKLDLSGFCQERLNDN